MTSISLAAVMKPKSSQAGGGGKGGKAEKLRDTDEAGLQSVVLLDSFNQNFDPVGCPSCLLPVAGIPILEYTLEWLSSQGAGEILLFTARHVGAVKEYLLRPLSRWAQHLDTRPISSTLGLAAQDDASAAARIRSPRLRVLSSSDASSPGDALRALDGMGALRAEGSFLLCERPMVTNLDMRSAWAAHYARAALDVNTTLTAIMQPFCAARDACPPSIVTACAVDMQDGRVWGWRVLPASAVDAGQGWKAEVSKATVPKDVRPRLSLRTDWCNTGVYLCTRSVAVHFSDNYDYYDISAHYVANEVDNVDMGWRFHVHLAERAYICGPIDLRGLLAVQQSVLAGLVSPLTPDGVWACHPLTIAPTWTSPSRTVYIAQDAVVDPTAVASLGMFSLVCSGAVLGAGCRVSGSVIGRGAVLGEGAVVTDSLVLDGAVVKAGAVVHASLIGMCAHVGAGAHVPRACILGHSSRIGEGQAVPPFARITCTQFHDGFGDSPKRLTVDSPVGSTVAIVGTAGVGRLWPAAGELERPKAGGDSDEDEDEDGMLFEEEVDLQALAATADAVRDALNQYDAAARTARTDTPSASGPASELGLALSKLAAIVRPALASMLLSGAPDFYELHRAAALAQQAPPASAAPSAVHVKVFSKAATGSSAGHPPTASSAPSTPFSRLVEGVRDILQADRPGHVAPDPVKLPGLKMEIRSCKLQTNTNNAEVRRALLPLILDWMPRSDLTMSSLTTALGAWLHLLVPYSDPGRREDEVSVVACIADYVGGQETEGDPPRAPLKGMFGIILLALYNADVITGVGVCEWAAEAEATGSDATKTLISAKTVQLLLQRIEDDEEEEDDDDEEEDA